MNRREFLKVAAACAATVALPAQTMPVAAPASGRRTNIILIMIDDLGWMDLHCQGNERLDTPNIDRLASQGMRFTDAYAAAPVCSPTRAAIMTGQSPARLRITNHLPDREQFQPDNAKLRSAKMLEHLPLEHVTLAERLREAGYTTAFLGKWHLSGRGKAGDLAEPKLRPEHQGFDVNVGGCGFGGPPSYFEPYRIPNIKPRREGEYLPDRLADEAIDFVRANRDKPFLVALWNYTVHWPMQAPQNLVEKYESRIGPGVKDARYAAMIEAMDSAIGRVITTLDELKLADDTRPLRASKGYLYEGGIRVPLIVRWPGVVKPGSTCRTPVISTDFYPTLLEVAGVAPDADKKLDGESIVPTLRQTDRLKRKAIFFHYPNYAWHRSNRLGGAIREGDYKLIKWYDDESVELYNLADDLSEKNDLSEKMPRKASDLKRKLEAWLAESGAAMPERI
ncbi:MAG: sulfatase [Planctomycetota bacterium]|jgi:arylsulfatase A-like enzyme